MTILSKLSATALAAAVLCGLIASYYWMQYWMGTPTVETVFNALVFMAAGLALTLAGFGLDKAAGWGA